MDRCQAETTHRVNKSKRGQARALHICNTLCTQGCLPKAGIQTCTRSYSEWVNRPRILEPLDSLALAPREITLLWHGLRSFQLILFKLKAFRACENPLRTPAGPFGSHAGPLGSHA